MTRHPACPVPHEIMPAAYACASCAAIRAAAIEALEWAAKLVEARCRANSLECCEIAVECAADALAQGIRAEIERRKKGR